VDVSLEKDADGKDLVHVVFESILEGEGGIGVDPLAAGVIGVFPTIGKVKDRISNSETLKNEHASGLIAAFDLLLLPPNLESPLNGEPPFDSFGGALVAPLKPDFLLIHVLDPGT
jgi:hypothetical protein